MTIYWTVRVDEAYCFIANLSTHTARVFETCSPSHCGENIINFTNLGFGPGSPPTKVYYNYHYTTHAYTKFRVNIYAFKL